MTWIFQTIRWGNTSFSGIIRNTLFYVFLELPKPYITRFFTKITNTTFYYLFPLSTQKGEQKSP